MRFTNLEYLQHRFWIRNLALGKNRAKKEGKTMELRKTVNAINAICGDGKRIEIFYGDLGADCGYYAS